MCYGSRVLQDAQGPHPMPLFPRGLRKIFEDESFVLIVNATKQVQRTSATVLAGECRAAAHTTSRDKATKSEKFSQAVLAANSPKKAGTSSAKHL